MSRMEATTAGNDHCVLQQFSFPGRRDYQLRSYNTRRNGNISLTSVGSNAVVDFGYAAPNSSPDLLNFQSQRCSAVVHDLQESQLPPTLSMNHLGNSSAENLNFQLSGSLRNVDGFLSSMDKLRSGYSSFHNWQWSERGSSRPGTPELGSSADARSVGELPKCEMDHHQYLSSDENLDKRPEVEAEAQQESNLPSDILKSRNSVRSEFLEVSSCYAAQVLGRSSIIKGCRWVGGEIERVASYPFTDGRVETQGASSARACTGLERASSCNNIRRAYRNSKRRPSASIAWDSLNESPEDSPMRKPVAAVPFNWEEAPGRARRTMTAGGDRALVRKLSRKKCYPMSYFERGQQTASKRSKEDKVGTRAGAQEYGREEAKSSGVRDPNVSAVVGAYGVRISGVNTRDPDRNANSFRSSRRRYYARMSSGVSDTSTSSSCARFSNADQLEMHQAQIDLVAPAAAKFLVDSTNTMSPLPTPSKHGLAVPFKWEEAPGKPKKVDHNSATVASLDQRTTVAPPVLQLPPRLIATVHKSTFDANTNKATEMRRSQYVNQFMSAPFSVWYYPTPNSDLSAAAVAAVQRRVSRSECSQSSSESHLRQSGSMEGWIGVLKSPFESVTRASLNLQSPASRTSTLGWTTSGPMSGPISTRLHESLESSDASENSWYHHHHQEEQQQHHHEQHHHNHHHNHVAQDGNLASSPTSILCGPTCENHQRPSPSSIPSSVSDVEVQQSGTPTVLSASYSNSHSLSTSQESSERSSSDLASPTSSLRTLLRKCKLKSEWPNSKSKWLTNMGGSDTHQPDLQLSGTMSSEPWCSPAVDPYFQSLDLTKDAAAASAKTGPQLELLDHGESTATITSSLVKFNAHDCVSELDMARHGSNLFMHKVGYDHQLQSSKLQYAVLAAVEQEQMVQDRFRAEDQANFVRCLHIPCSPARFLSRTTEAAGSRVDQTLCVDNPSWVSPASYAEDGYRSPAYTATLELLSPSADLMARRRGSGFRTRSLKFPRIAMTKSLLLESMCKSLKHTVLKCAMVCCHRTGPLLRHDEHYISANDFQFCKPI